MVNSGFRVVANTAPFRAITPVEDRAIALHFYRLWLDLGVPQDSIQLDWLPISLEFIATARRTLHYQAYVAEVDGIIVGSASGQLFAGLYPPILTTHHRQYGYIWGVYVEPAHRNQGIATRLTRLMVDYQKALGCTKAILNAAPKARSTYQKIGFGESNLMELDLS
ncbi:MAG: GNAT family N-acetyltransferase [Leptolyngbyaceae cyanobacterium SM2_5_2]|nr:GNAT family N-acetyltransferase [Leptolyngbyaceae cyanobacterium SM2_5_2]